MPKKAKSKKLPHIIVAVRGGVVYDVKASTPVKVEVLDYDSKAEADDAVAAGVTDEYVVGEAAEHRAIEERYDALPLSVW